MLLIGSYAPDDLRFPQRKECSCTWHKPDSTPKIQLRSRKNFGVYVKTSRFEGTCPKVLPSNARDNLARYTSFPHPLWIEMTSSEMSVHAAFYSFVRASHIRFICYRKEFLRHNSWLLKSSRLCGVDPTIPTYTVTVPTTQFWYVTIVVSLCEEWSTELIVYWMWGLSHPDVFEHPGLHMLLPRKFKKFKPIPWRNQAIIYMRA